jgi:hypothetical protein
MALTGANRDAVKPRAVFNDLKPKQPSRVARSATRDVSHDEFFVKKLSTRRNTCFILK